MNSRTIGLCVMAVLTMWIGAGTVPAGNAGGVWGSVAAAAEDNSLGALKQRFRERYAALLKAKEAGKIGETFDGFVEAVKPLDEKDKQDQALSKLIQAENADRRTLYKIIAEREETTPTLVAERNARRNFQKAEPGEYLKGQNGQWTRKPERKER